MNNTKRICLSVGAVLSLGVVLFIFGLIFYIFLTTPNSISDGSGWSGREVGILDDYNTTTDISKLNSRKRSAKLVEWVNLNPDSPWTAALNPSAIGMEHQQLAGAVSEVLSKSSTMQTYLRQFYNLVEKEFHQLYSEHVDSLERQQLRKVPTHFNAAWRWPKCAASILRARDQGGCGSCWAVSAIATIADRMCIASKGRLIIDFSAQHMIECCSYCGGCQGTVEPLLPFFFWHQEGVTEESCYPFAMDTSCGHPCRPDSFHPAKGLGKCSNTCTNPLLPSAYKSAKLKKRRAKYVYKIGSLHSGVADDGAEFEFTSSATTLFGLHLRRNQSAAPGGGNGKRGVGPAKMSIEEMVKRELMTYGPLVLCFNVFEGFLHFYDGVYDFAGHDSQLHVYDHCAKLIGWGEYRNNITEASESYLLAVNSWSTKWARDGLFKLDLRALKTHRADFYAGVPDEADDGESNTASTPKTKTSTNK